MCGKSSRGSEGSVNGQMFICADHGNAEQLVDYRNREHSLAHTTNQVQFILVNADRNIL